MDLRWDALGTHLLLVQQPFSLMLYTSTCITLQILVSDGAQKRKSGKKGNDRDICAIPLRGTTVCTAVTRVRFLSAYVVSSSPTDAALFAQPPLMIFRVVSTHDIYDPSTCRAFLRITAATNERLLEHGTRQKVPICPREALCGAPLLEPTPNLTTS